MIFELEPADISALNDSDLRELVARLTEAELIQQGIQPSCVTWGGAQEAPDGGLDVSVKNAAGISKPNFVPNKDTGFQVKKHSMGRAACKKEMQESGKLKAVIADLAARQGAYIIVSGKDDCTDKMRSERLNGMKEAVAELEDGNKLHLDFYGVDRLSAWLRRHPSVALWARARLGKPLSGWKPYGRWGATPQGQDDEFLTDDHPCVIDANSNSKEPMPVSEGIQLTRNRLRQPGGTVRITGLSGVGKTRFAQALFEPEVGTDKLPASDVIYADLGDELRPTATELVTYLVANDFAAYLVLDNCPPDVHRSLQKQVAQSKARLHLLTVEYDISDDKPEETQVIHLEPTSEKTVSKLVQKRFPALGRINADRIAEFAGGNARIALALASRVEADETLSNFSDEALFHRLFTQRKGASTDLLQSAEALALVYSFNVSRSESNDELSALASISGLTRQALHRDHAELLRRQVAQQRGHWRAVLPHALANRLAKRALENIACEDINAELFKTANLRLLQSCAHRLGYLHDFPQALALATTWIQPGGPLADIAICQPAYLIVLDHVAPVFPDVVLSAIEKAAMVPDFASRQNPHFVRFVRLLCHLAYEDNTFDRAANVLLKFAETEKPNENNNSIVGDMRQLFSLHLSGTEASPARRQAFVKSLLHSGNPRHQEIAEKLLHSAFEARRWTSFGLFHFGARKRGPGWTPGTESERLGWYVGFIELLEPLLGSAEQDKQAWAKELLASRFRELWGYAGCFDVLERLINEHGRDGKWPGMWNSIRKTIHFDGDDHMPTLLTRLKSLETLTAPSDLCSDIEAYAFSDAWGYGDVKGETYEERAAVTREKLLSLGELAATQPDCLNKLGSRLWKKPTQSIYWLGEGLAAGSTDKVAMFDILVESYRAHRSSHAVVNLIEGYLWGVNKIDPEVARQVLQRALNVPDLRWCSAALLTAIPITPWASAKLLELARGGELEAWRFEQICYGRRHERMSDQELSALLVAINALDNGFFSAIEMLTMRFHESEPRQYVPSEELRAVGRATIRRLVSANRHELQNGHLHGLDRVIAKVLDASAPESEVKEIIALLCDGIESYRLYAFELTELLSALISMYPELLLDEVFNGREEEASLAFHVFRDRAGRAGATLNAVSVERLLGWCRGDEDRIAKVAQGLRIFVTSDKTDSADECPKRVVLSGHIKSILEVASDKTAIVAVVFDSIHPQSWSGSLADILESRSQACAELLTHPDSEVRELVKTKLALLQQLILREREREATEYNEREQRFE